MASGWLAGLAGGLGSLGQHFAMLGQREYEDRLRQEQQEREDARLAQQQSNWQQQFGLQQSESQRAAEQFAASQQMQSQNMLGGILPQLEQGADLSSVRSLMEGSPLMAYGQRTPTLGIGADQPGDLLGAPVVGERFERRELTGDAMRQLQEDMQRAAMERAGAAEQREATTFGQRQGALAGLPESVRPFATLGMSPYDAMTPDQQIGHDAKRQGAIYAATAPFRSTAASGQGRDSDDWRQNYNAEYARQIARLKEGLTPFGFPSDMNNYAANLQSADQQARELATTFADQQLQRFGGGGAPSPAVGVAGELADRELAASPNWQQLKTAIDEGRAGGMSDEEIYAEVAPLLTEAPPEIQNTIRMLLGRPAVRR